MRLLNVYNLAFAKFQDNEIPPYAIASHRWCNDEATYLDVMNGENKYSDGFKKIRGFCDFTKERNKRGNLPRIEWIWIDTCCIDQRHSQDVSENIFSMFGYYERSEECYVYLWDVQELPPTRASIYWDFSAFKRSSWFTRGWTLQELLAPRKVTFINADWRVYGHKCPLQAHKDDSSDDDSSDESDDEAGDASRHGSSDESRDDDRWRVKPQWCTCSLDGRPLNSIISQTTHISPEILNREYRAEAVSPVSICHWMYRRETQRVEDLAYCLLGLLGVSMAPLYGEGSYAWERLERKARAQRTCDLRLVKPRQLGQIGLEPTSHERATQSIQPGPAESVASGTHERSGRAESSSSRHQRPKALLGNTEKMQSEALRQQARAAVESFTAEGYSHANAIILMKAKLRRKALDKQSPKDRDDNANDDDDDFGKGGAKRGGTFGSVGPEAEAKSDCAQRKPSNTVSQGVMNEKVSSDTMSEPWDQKWQALQARNQPQKRKAVQAQDQPQAFARVPRSAPRESTWEVPRSMPGSRPSNAADFQNYVPDSQRSYTFGAPLQLEATTKLEHEDDSSRDTDGKPESTKDKDNMDKDKPGSSGNKECSKDTHTHHGVPKSKLDNNIPGIKLQMDQEVSQAVPSSWA